METMTAVPAHLEQHTHSRKGFEMWIVVLHERVEREQYLDLKAEAVRLCGWWSRPWNGTPGGFAFKIEANAEQFITEQLECTDQPTEAPMSTPRPKPSQGPRLRELAEKAQAIADDKLADRQTNTAKRLAQAAHTRLDGERMQRTAQALLALADHHDAGTVPPELVKITSRKAAYDLLGTELEPVSNGYHMYHYCTGEPRDTTPEAVALWSLIGRKTDEDKRADELRRKRADLQDSKIPGFFPTPPVLASLMVLRAEIKPHNYVLEPSAGSGVLADAVLKAEPTATVSCFEINPTLASLLELAGHNVDGDDFLEHEPANPYADRVVMNPPFERLADIDHVRHAFDMLKPGGRLVSIMSPSPFFRTDAKAVAFREWFDELGGELEELESGAFKDSGTGVESRLVVIDKPYED